jgi:hypothetical protein
MPRFIRLDEETEAYLRQGDNYGAHSDHAAQSHSAHTGGAVDAHGVTQPNQHGAQSHSAHDSVNSEPAYYALCFIQKT